VLLNKGVDRVLFKGEHAGDVVHLD
jgi:hypothetical protein